MLCMWHASLAYAIPNHITNQFQLVCFRFFFTRRIYSIQGSTSVTTFYLKLDFITKTLRKCEWSRQLSLFIFAWVSLIKIYHQLPVNSCDFMYKLEQFCFLDYCEARRRPKIVVPTTKSYHLQYPNKKADFEYNEYEYPANGHPVVEESEENDQQELREQQQQYPQLKSHSHKKPPGYSAGSGLRSIAQGSADQVRFDFMQKQLPIICMVFLLLRFFFFSLLLA